MRQKRILVDKITSYFADRGGLEGKTLALWGVAFKPNTDDIREAPALEMIAELTAAGMRVQAFDPAAGNKAEEALAGNNLVSVHGAQYDVLEGADVLVVATEWNQFRNPDFSRIRKTLNEPVIFDGRNLYAPEFLQRFGLQYFCIGRGHNGVL